jgi:hypothetical protein
MYFSPSCQFGAVVAKAVCATSIWSCGTKQQHDALQGVPVDLALEIFLLLLLSMNPNSNLSTAGSVDATRG